MKADGLTIMQLAKATPPYVRSRAQTAVIKKLKSTKTKNGFLAIQAVAVDTFNDRPRPHKCFIISRDHKAGDGHRMYEKGNRVLVSCDCFTGDNRVLTKDGWKTMFEIAEPFTGESSITYIVNGREHVGTAPYYKGMQKVWELQLSNGRTVTATRNQRFLTYVRKEGTTTRKWRTLGRLSVGDRLCADTFITPAEKQEKLEAFVSRGYSEKRDARKIATVVGITYKGRQPVYDITVPSIARFNVEGVIAHNCEFFTFTCEYALTQWGASRIVYSNGEPALTTNPSNTPILCIAKGQRVHTKRGLVPIEDVQAGDVVQSHTGWNVVLASARTGFRETVYLKTQFGRNVRCTPDHKVLAVRGGHVGWYEAGSLSVGDWIVSKAGAFDSNVSASSDACDYARLLGYYIAEGTGSVFSQPVEFDNVRSDFFETCRKLGYAAEFIPQTTEQNRGIQIPDVLLIRFYSDGFVQDSYARRVPRYLFQAAHSEVVAFLRGLYAGDGYVTEKVSTLGSTSKKLLRDVQQLLTALGVATGLYYNKNSGANHIDMWLLRTTNVRNTQKLIQLLDPIRRHKIQGTAPERVTKYVPFDVRGQLLRYERQALRKKFAIYASESDQRVGDLFRRFGIGGDAVKRSLFTRGISYEHRDRVGGKPSHYVSVSAFVDSLFEKLVRRHARKARLLYGKGSRSCGVAKVESYLRKVELDKLSRKSRRLVSLILDPDVGFEQIVSVKDAKPCAVYDLTVENAHSFVVDGLVVHNCKHLFALTKELKTKGM